MPSPRESRSLDVFFIVFYLVAALPLQGWAYLAAPLPFMNFGPPLWPNVPAYMVAAPLVGYLLLGGSPRARLAAYVFLTFDILRSWRLAHWLPLAFDVAILLYLQTPRMRRIYPSMWSRWKAIRPAGP